MLQSEILEKVISVLPLTDQMIDIDLTEQDAIIFTWRATRFLVSQGLFVVEIRDGMEYGSNCAILLSALLSSYSPRK